MPRLSSAQSCTLSASIVRRPLLRRLRYALPAGLLLLTAAGTLIVTDLTIVRRVHSPAAEHLDQQSLLALVQQGRNAAAFAMAFEHGDELFETSFNALDGVGANVGGGQRFTRIPRADYAGAGEWANHMPSRATGPNADSCTSCHNLPFADGAGGAAANVHRDPLHTGNLHQMIQRNTPHLFAAGAVQRLAEEMTVVLTGIRAQLVAQVRRTNQPASAALVAKGVDFGMLDVSPSRFSPTGVRIDTSRVSGIDPDLVVKPFQWKGSVKFLRDFNRGAAHNELGMQAAELVGDGVDGDGDQVADEMTVGDMTALAIYAAALPRPVTKIELSALGLIPQLSAGEVGAIERGALAFVQVGCNNCHVPSMRLQDPVFHEPSAFAEYRDATFPGGQVPNAVGVRPDYPVSFDLTSDQTENVVVVNGVKMRLGSLRSVDNGQAVVDLYGDLKRHRMGPGLAEDIDEVGTGPAMFLTENLWGVGSTAPYLHDGRATTLTEAILEHGGEAVAARTAFAALPKGVQMDLVAFLNNLVLWKAPE